MVNAPDPQWPSAASLLGTDGGPAPERRGVVSLLGAHTYTTSLTPRSSEPTPAAVRAALARFSTWSFEDQSDLLDSVVVRDHGDVEFPDTDEGAARLANAFDTLFPTFWILLGGDNALTWRAMTALARGSLSEWGLITLDAHLDLREGQSNGSPVRQLIADGLPGSQVVQVGLADFSNSAAYAHFAEDAGVRVIARHELRRRSIADVAEEALNFAGAGGRRIYVDVDMDVCDRSVVPGCPAAVPGGLSADELRQFVRIVSAHPQVFALDVTEVDVTRDASDERTVRLAALVVLEALAGYVRRQQ
ncbi:MAG TPA: agmatinase family protein [Acidimicrobiales bacterium]